MTCSIRSKPMAGVERVPPIVLALGLAVALAGCNTTQPLQPTQMTAALAAAAAAGAGADRRTALAWAARYRANPSDPEAVVNYARALRAYGQRAQAVAVLEQALYGAIGVKAGVSSHLLVRSDGDHLLVPT